MGDIKDIEDYKHKIEKQAKLRRKTIKAIKEHFRLEDIPLIESKMINEIKIPDEPVKPAPKEQKIIPKIKTSIVARPIFTTSYERYEWHMKNGYISNEDRTWLASYIQSSEFKEIYN